MHAIEATVDTNGAVVIPAEIQRRLGLTAGSRVRFVVAEDGVRLDAPRRRYEHTLESVQGTLPGKAGFSADLDEEIEEAMADELAAKYGHPADR